MDDAKDMLLLVRKNREIRAKKLGFIE